MAKQLHKRFAEDQVKDIVTNDIEKKLRAKEACRYLGIGRTRLHELTVIQRTKPEDFKIEYKRHTSNNKLKLKLKLKEHILSELKFEKEKIIDNPNVPTNRYNYSYIRNLLSEKYDEQVSFDNYYYTGKSK